jgi:hypothetical protein
MNLAKTGLNWIRYFLKINRYAEPEQNNKGKVVGKVCEQLAIELQYASFKFYLLLYPNAKNAILL